VTDAMTRFRQDKKENIFHCGGEAAAVKNNPL
jgi:hypothetical protein